MSDRRLLLVHAHPDDETIGTGATMAKYAAEGAHVTLVTCTLGDEGEVIPPELRNLQSDRADALGTYRIGELARACAALGVTDHRFLGGPGRWRDSGMMGTPPNEHPDCFWKADVDEAAELLAEVIREVRPQVVVTYDDNGGYGHPDHIQAHRVTVAALAKAPGPRLFYTAFPKSVLQAGIDALRAAGDTTTFDGVGSADDLPFGNPDDEVTHRVDARAHLPQKLAAMRAHATQISVDGPFFALSDNVGHEAMGYEYFICADGDRTGTEDDLFGSAG